MHLRHLSGFVRDVTIHSAPPLRPALSICFRNSKDSLDNCQRFLSIFFFICVRIFSTVDIMWHFKTRAVDWYFQLTSANFPMSHPIGFSKDPPRWSSIFDIGCGDIKLLRQSGPWSEDFVQVLSYAIYFFVGKCLIQFYRRQLAILGLFGIRQWKTPRPANQEPFCNRLWLPAL